MAVTLAQFDAILLDIEGTVCPISFVRDVLYPFALTNLASILTEQWERAEFAKYRDAFPVQFRSHRIVFEEHIRDLMSKDVKAPYLKALQGYIWQRGYETGQLKAPIFPDVGPFIHRATMAKKKVMIYSSGSVHAQKLFFAHTNEEQSDLTPHISAWFDTVSAGPKTEVSSYQIIMRNYQNIDHARWLFLTDNINEVDAAIRAGMTSIPVTRPGNAPLPSNYALNSSAISDFSAESIS